MDTFISQRNAIEIKAKEAKPDVPKHTKNMAVAKWNDYMRVYAAQVFGVRKPTLNNLLRKETSVNSIPTPLVTYCPHLSQAVSIKDTQAMQLSHTHTLYHDDNKTLFGVLEVDMRRTTYDVSITSFQKTYNGRTAYLMVIAQHAGKDKWAKILRDYKTYVNERKWDGTTSPLLQSHI